MRDRESNRLQIEKNGILIPIILEGQGLEYEKRVRLYLKSS